MGHILLRISTGMSISKPVSRQLKKRAPRRRCVLDVPAGLNDHSHCCCLSPVAVTPNPLKMIRFTRSEVNGKGLSIDCVKSIGIKLRGRLEGYRDIQEHLAPLLPHIKRGNIVKILN